MQIASRILAAAAVLSFVALVSTPAARAQPVETKVANSLGKDGSPVDLNIHEGQRLLIYDSVGGTSHLWEGDGTSGAAFVEGPDAHDAAITGQPLLIGAEAETLGAVSTVDADGDVSQAKLSPSGIFYQTPTTHDGTVAACEDVDDAAPGGVLMQGVEAESLGSVSAVGAEGDATGLKGSLSGVQYVMVVDEDGSDVGTVTVGAGSATIGAVDIQLDGTDASADQGIAGTGTQRVKEAQPDDNEDGLVTVAQDAACAATYAIPADAYETTCQNQDPADYIRVRAVDAADTSTGFLLAPEGSGAGQVYTTRLRGVSLCFFNDTDATNATVYCASDTEQ